MRLSVLMSYVRLVFYTPDVTSLSMCILEILDAGSIAHFVLFLVVFYSILETYGSCECLHGSEREKRDYCTCEGTNRVPIRVAQSRHAQWFRFGVARHSPCASREVIYGK